MANFSIRTNAQIIPLEEITYTDTTQKTKGIHSTIDRSFSANTDTSYATTATNVRQINIDFEDDNITGETSFGSLTSITNTITFVYAVMTKDTDEEGIYIKFGTTTVALFRAGRVGDYMLLPLTSVLGNNLNIGTNGAYTAKGLTFVVGYT